MAADDDVQARDQPRQVQVIDGFAFAVEAQMLEHRHQDHPLHRPSQCLRTQEIREEWEPPRPCPLNLSHWKREGP